MDKIYQLTPHIYILPFDRDTDRPNLGYIRAEIPALFDAGCGPKNAKLLKNQLRDRGFPLPEKIIISHFHWDHCFASGYLEGEIIAGQFTRDKMREMMNLKISSFEDLIDEERFMPRFCREHLPLEYADVSQIRLRPADRVIGERERLDLGDLHITLKQVTSPHCPGQTVAFVEEDKVLFVGDSYSACITGYDFVDDLEKRRIFYEDIREFDFDYIVLSHFDVMKKEDFWREALEKLKA